MFFTAIVETTYLIINAPESNTMTCEIVVVYLGHTLVKIHSGAVIEVKDLTN